ncbi:MAG: tetratricopeptide repeat protein [Myxococcota bacterium]
MVDLEEAPADGLCAEVAGAPVIAALRGDVAHLGAVSSPGAAPGCWSSTPRDLLGDALALVLAPVGARGARARLLVGARSRLADADHEVALAPLAERDAGGAAPRVSATCWPRPTPPRCASSSLFDEAAARERAAARAVYVPLPSLVDTWAAPSSRRLRAAFESSWAGLQPDDQAVLQPVDHLRRRLRPAGRRRRARAARRALGRRRPRAPHRLQPRPGRRDAEPVPAAVVGAHARGRAPPPPSAMACAVPRRGYRRLAGLVDSLRDGPDRGDEGGVLLVERRNLLAALRRALRRDDVRTAGACALCVLGTLARSGPLSAGLALIAEVLGSGPPSGPPRPYEPELRTCAGVFSGALGDLQGGLAHLTEALDVARRAGDRAAEIGAELGIGNLLREMGNPSAAEVNLDRARTAAEALGHRRLLARVIADLAPIYRVRGDLDSAERFLVRAIALFREVGNRRGEATSLNNLGNLRAQRGQTGAARDLYLEALRVATVTGDDALTATVYGNLALGEGREGQPGAAVSYLQRALALNRRMGAVPMEVVNLGNLGWALVEQGELEAARGVLEDGLALAERHGVVWLSSVSLGNLAHLELLEGRWEPAWALARRALQVELDAGDRHGACVVRLLLAKVARVRGELGVAEAQLEEAMAWARQADDGSLLGDARLERAVLRLVAGRPLQAEEDLRAAQAALTGLEGLKARAGLVWVRHARGEGLAALEEELDRLAEAATRMGIGPRAPLFRWLGEVRRAIGA